ncbi:MAG: hypothetical protein EOM23_08025 [Candidatus Moranbacteria bacterium]|nr:hypothetical protein [Candidatus Moranbacteria bacterium]
MNTINRPNPSELICPHCGRLLEVTTVETADGHYQQFFQCWQCFTSTPGRKITRIPLHIYQEKFRENVPMSTLIIGERSIQTKGEI